MPVGGAAGCRRVRRLAGVSDRVAAPVRRVRGAPREARSGLAKLSMEM